MEDQSHDIGSTEVDFFGRTPNEILQHIIELAAEAGHDNWNTPRPRYGHTRIGIASRLSIVSHRFNKAATPLLYKRIKVLIGADSFDLHVSRQLCLSYTLTANKYLPAYVKEVDINCYSEQRLHDCKTFELARQSALQLLSCATEATHLFIDIVYGEPTNHWLRPPIHAALQNMRRLQWLGIRRDFQMLSLETAREAVELASSALNELLLIGAGDLTTILPPQASIRFIDDSDRIVAYKK